MGGMGSGGNRRLSEAEKRERGTFVERNSDANLLARAAEKVITGVFLAKVTDPEMPMSDVGRKKYFEYAELLLNGNKLTKVTRDYVEVYATLWEQMHNLKVAGKPVPMQLIVKMDAIARNLRVAEDAPAIANPNQKNKFASIGTANNVISAFRLRAPARTGNGDL